jgi:membrane protein DedA with SNARE-associated domain
MMRLLAAAAGVLVAFRVLHPNVAVAVLLAGQVLLAAIAFRRGLRLRASPPRVIGAGVLTRTPADWAQRLERRPVLTALTTRFVPREHEVAFTAATCAGRLPAGFLIASAVSWCLWVFVVLIVSSAAAALIAAPLSRAVGVPGLILGVALALMLPALVMLLLTREGRLSIRRSFHRATRREYWPAWFQYLLLGPLFVRLGLKHGPAAFTCCNPGIPAGGGMIGESKRQILDALGSSPLLLAAACIEPGPDPAARARAALDAIASRPELGGFPVILKPDAGQRGFAVRLARSVTDVEIYFRSVASPVLVQRFHPGPEECGVAWVRHDGASPNGHTGRIFSITRKTFPVLTGDGRSTFEDLIHRHPRFHCQAHVFLERFAEQRGRALGAGETLRLAQAGNHCQGVKCSDGADLASPALEAALDGLASRFAGGLDAGRFDLRYESDEALRRAEGFAVVELNGTAGEPTNIYDPDRSIAWAYSVLADQWRILYRLGDARCKQGVRPMSLFRLVSDLRRHYRERTGSEVSD